MEKVLCENGEEFGAGCNEEQFASKRLIYIKEKFELNKLKVYAYGGNHLSLHSNRSRVENSNGGEGDMLSRRMAAPLKIFKAFSADKDEADIHSALEMPSIELPNIEKLPQSVTWVSTNRNHLMAKSDSVIGKAQIYYTNGKPTKLSAKKNEENKEKTECSKNEEYVEEASDSGSRSTNSSHKDIDHFCRRCLVFNCQLHEKSLNVIKFRENKLALSENEIVREPCSRHCYLKQRSVTEVAHDKETNVVSYEWTPVEKDLYLDGVKIFGKNSCLITKNLLWGLKSCVEVYNYMCEQDQCTMLPVHYQTAETCNQVNKKNSRKRKSSKMVHRNNCYPSAFKKLVKEENKAPRQYKPCTCEPVCGHECSCLASGNCCEQYCGCPKTCSNRFRGCGCAKGQCGDRRCPCFAAKRECDPDICQSCWLGCGDGALKESQCKNMNFLMKHQKRIFKGKSTIQGWGAFTQESLKKNDFLGEYTGELISQEEADERGRAEEKIGSSYLFDLNAELVVDARRQGSIFKYLNHSSDSNCSAKVVMVRGDHRIGIYANRDIQEGEELLLNYGYKADVAPAWYPSHGPIARSGI